jgi:hypothetical protein
MSERNRACEYPPISGIGELPSDVHEDTGVLPENRVREPWLAVFPPPLPPQVTFSLAHPSNRLTAQLNKDWRVMDDPLQWVLQRRKGNPRKKNTGWQERSFCTTRDGLLRCVREACGEVDDKALAQLHALPEFHTGWKPCQ